MRWPWKRENEELDQEIRYHLEALADVHERAGVPRAEAMRRARAEFGGVEQVKDACRDESRWNWFTGMTQDLRFGWRMMWKSPSVTIAAIGTLALGIGATTAIFSLAYSVLWKPLPVPMPEQLNELYWTVKQRPDKIMNWGSGSSFPDGALRVADFFSHDAVQRMRERAPERVQVANHILSPPVSLAMGSTVSVVRARGVSGNFFSVLGLKPGAGRLLLDSDDRAEATPAVVLAHRFWHSQLGGDPGVLRRQVQINSRAYQVVGVLPEEFTGVVPGDSTDIYVPIRQHPDALAQEGFQRKALRDPMAWVTQVLIRRAPGVREDEAFTILSGAFSDSWTIRPATDDTTPRLRLTEASRGLGAVRRSFGDPMATLLGMVALVLLVACANIANLLLARSVEREKEAALRVSLGCGRGRLMRQMFTESLLLAVTGGVLSVGVAAAAGHFLGTLVPTNLVYDPRIDPWTLAATGLMTVSAALLFGLYPAWRTSQVPAGPALKEGSGTGGTMSRKRWRASKMLVLAQVAAGVVLLSAAILFTGRLSYLVGRDPGFDRARLLLFDVRPGEVGHEGEKLKLFYRRMEERLRAVPGVEAASISWLRPMTGGGFWETIGTPNGRPVEAAVRHASAGYMETLQIPILMGRGLEDADATSARKVTVISEDMVRGLELTSPLGARVQIAGNEYEVVGVSRAANYAHMERTPPVAYLPFEYEKQSATVVLRTAGSPLSMAGPVRAAMKELDSRLPLVDFFSMEQQISRTLQRERMFAWLCGCFGALALVLCAVGLYGLMAHTTARRTGEIGIRMALGATQGNVLGQVMREGLGLAAAGLLVGAPVAVYAARLAAASRLLPEGPIPYWTLAAALAALTAAATVAVLGPALRAATVEPLTALRRG